MRIARVRPSSARAARPANYSSNRSTLSSSRKTSSSLSSRRSYSLFSSEKKNAASAPPSEGRTSSLPSGASLAKNIDLLSHVWKSRASDVIVEKAKGSWIWGHDGRKYLDFACGIAVTSLGHCHPRVVKAAQDQLENIVHGQANIVYHRPMLRLAELLSKKVKLSEKDQFFFTNSGAEAIEGAMKLARLYTKKQNIISFQGSFHGRTVGTMSITNSKTIYRVGAGPLMPTVSVAPYAYCLHCPCTPDQKKASTKARTLNTDNNVDSICCNEPLKAVETLLKTQSAPEDTAAIILEPVLGEGGYVVPPRSFLQGLREICDKNKMLLILDEVQTGFGRTGKMFAMEHFGVTPDILILAKGIANGMPLSCVAAPKKVMDTWTPGSHGGTYAGNAVSCASAVAVLETMDEEKTLDNVNARGKELVDALQRLKKKYPVIRDVRGLGLMIGVELHERVPYGTSSAIAKAALENEGKDTGMILLTCSIYETLRVIPPLNVSKEDMAQGIEIIEKAFHKVLSPLK